MSEKHSKTRTLIKCNIQMFDFSLTFISAIVRMKESKRDMKELIT